jgi:DNA-binding MarR family transcriptional regulator
MGDGLIDSEALRMAGTTLQLGRALDQSCRRADDQLGVVDLSVLRQLERGNDLPSRVARALRLDPGRVTRIIDQLVPMGYVQREADAVDRRRCRLLLTPAGKDRLERGRHDVTEAMTGLLAGLTEEQRRELQRGLDGVRRVLDELAAAT